MLHIVFFSILATNQVAPTNDQMIDRKMGVYLPILVQDVFLLDLSFEITVMCFLIDASITEIESIALEVFQQ